MTENVYDHTQMLAAQNVANNTQADTDQVQNFNGQKQQPIMSDHEALAMIPDTMTMGKLAEMQIRNNIEHQFTPPPINMQDANARARGEWEPGYFAKRPFPPGVDIDVNAREARNMYNPITFYNKVKEGGDWDFKRLAKGQPNNPYEPSGNYHFSIVAHAYGIPEGIAKRGAGLYQILKGRSLPEWGDHPELGILRYPYAMTHYPYGDDPMDGYEIGEGYKKDEFDQRNIGTGIGRYVGEIVDESR